MIVVDASVVAEAIVNRDSAYLAVLLTGEAAAPAHLDAEVLSVFRGLVRGGHLRSGDLPAYTEALATAPIERLDIPVLASTAITMFENLTAYDALYVSAAMHHDARLCTRDHGMAQVAARVGVPLVTVA
ncbi:type II toxin-antitoxin system VapC family toxin [Jiangella rhizosphaerae]|uniref:PIN domain-containing protein n=1 Tax=Jiangella rhizosphaerae TaxID=2293569 RepID=A0A418KT57_9ACTN|nr:type II toxin-antitoxin system VapC family toxin [Jiangella rhizosphaerae]RIQ29170.1 PIN domain-containing protein [Jiangella rhizosphaerae]